MTEVEVRSVQGRRMPAIDVKVGAWEVKPSDFVGSFEDAFLGWLADEMEHDGEELSAWWDLACEDGREEAQELAREVFGPHVKVWADGRSGGWLVVEGLPDVETWDRCGHCEDTAEDHDDEWCGGPFKARTDLIESWETFVARVGGLVADRPFQFVALVDLNVWEPMQDARADLSERFSHLPMICTA